MAISWQTAREGACWIGIDWRATTYNDKVTLAPYIYRSDNWSTDNYGSQFDESLMPDPNTPSRPYGWWGYFSWGSGSGDRVVETFATRTYTKTHSSQTVQYQMHTDASFGTWDSNYGGFAYIGERYFTFTYTIPAKTSYSVTYNANQGSGAPSSQTKWYGESLTLSSTVPTRTNYVFLNWNTKADGTGTTYSKGATYTGNAALTLYAQWKLNAWNVTYNGNGSGSTGVPATQQKIANTTLTLSSAEPTRPGYDFISWNTKADGTGTTYTPGASYTANAALALYAQWRLKTYTISYSANQGTGAPASQTKTHGASLTLSATLPQRTGYIFSSWNTNSGGTGTDYNPGASYNVDGNATLYAKWTEITYPVIYNGNASNASNLPANQQKHYTQDLTLASSPTPTRTGYTFSSWNTEADGTGTRYDLGDTYSTNAELRLFAQWTINTYAVTYYANGTSVTNVPQPQTKVYNTTLALTSDIPAREPYKFLGWAIAPTGPVAYQPGTSYSENAILDLYAKWEYQYSDPVLANVYLERCLQDGTSDDEGLYAKAVGDWSVDTRYYTNLTGGTATLSLLGKTGTQDLSSANSGKLAVVAGPFSESDTGTGTITITDGRGSSTSKTALFAKATFPIDVAFDSTTSSYSMGIMTVAPVNGVEIGDSTIFDGTLSFANATALPRQSSTSATMYPLAVNSFNDGATVHHMYRDDFLTWLQALPLSGGTLTGSLSSDGEVSATDANDVVHNLTEKANASSLAGYLPISGGTLTGQLEIPDSAVADASQTPSANQYGSALYVTDQQGEQVGYVGLVHETDDKLWTQIGVTRDVNGSPAYNSLWLGLVDDGTPTVYVGGAQQAWQKALNVLPLSGGEMTGVIVNKFSNGAIAQNTTSGTNQFLETVAQDQGGTWFASFVQQLDANRRTRIGMSLRNMNNRGTWVSNGLNLYVAKDGTPTVTVDQPAAWRTGIGANNASNLTAGTVAQARLLNNNWTYGWGSATANYCRYCKIGHIVYVEVGTNSGYSTNAGQTYTLCTLPSGLRPVGQNATNALYNYGGTVGMIDVLTSGKVNIKCPDGCSWWWGIIAFPAF